ncbi:Protein FAM114A2 [Frankliniella fusca]|uniref:Protein FAM114A2 n=1 Tax=Frankliniella fusca TaxID=407009 RepID=A0AAE1LCG2_9NEOP|nr:Protein FAM114A2 [Frankliniella fusca]
MANSESEDFESADEGINSKSTEGPPSSQMMSSAESSALTATSPADPGNLLTAASKKESSDQPHGIVPVGPAVNPESLGAKPKTLQKSKGKSYSKHRSQRNTAEYSDSIVSSTNNKPNNQAPIRKGRIGSSKLGVKISPPDIVPNEPVVSDSSKYKDNSPWSHDLPKRDENKDNQDVHDSIQPLLDKLASLDVVETSDEVIDPSSDKPVYNWGSWGSWGMNTILSGASSVSSHVTQGLSTMSSVIESGLGAVEPEEMAKLTVEDNKSVNTEANPAFPSDQASSSFNVMGNVLKFVESTGEMIVNSGLSTLESIGKKTMDVLQEGDPGLKKKRALFSREPDKPTLSQILREARNRAEVEDRERVQTKKATRAHFETLFDDYKGMIHLEALEMLSNTCQLKLEAKLLALSGTPLIEFQRKLIQIKEQCEIPDDDEEEEEDDDRGTIEILERDLTAAMRGLLVPVPHTKLIRVSEDTDTWLATMRCIQDEDSQNDNDEWVDEEDASEEADPQNALREIHQQAIQALARFTASVAEHFHKTAELLLLKEEHDCAVECQSVVMMTSALCSRVSSVAARFSELLSASANMLDSTQVDHNDVNLLITNVFLEASNSSSYIQDASQLLIPVLQLGAVQ